MITTSIHLVTKTALREVKMGARLDALRFFWSSYSFLETRLIAIPDSIAT